MGNSNEQRRENLYHGQTRRRAARPGGRHREALRAEGLQAVRHQGEPVARGALRGALGGPEEQEVLPGLVSYMASSPVVAMCWQGLNAVSEGRKLLGATHPKDSLPGTFRGDFCIDIGLNLCHGSDSVEST